MIPEGHTGGGEAGGFVDKADEPAIGVSGRCGAVLLCLLYFFCETWVMHDVASANHCVQIAWSII